MIRKISKLLVALALILAMSGIVALIFFHRYIQGSEFKEKIVVAASNMLGTRFHLEQLKFNILSGFELHNVEVDNPPPNNAERFLKIQQVNLQYSLMALLHRQLIIRELSLMQPEITVTLNNDGTSNIPHLKKSESSSLPLFNIEDLHFNVLLNRFNLAHGQMLLYNASREQLFAMNDANIQGAYEQTPNVAEARGKIDVQTITLGSNFKITGASSPITYNGEKLVFPDIKGVSYMGSATGALEADFGAKEPSFNLNLKLTDAQMSALAQDFGKDLDWLQGKLLLTTQLEGSLLQPKLLTGKGDFSIADIGVAKFKLLQDIGRILFVKELNSVQFKDIKGTFKVGDQKITFFNIEAVSDSVQLSGAGSITFDRQVDFDVLLAINDKLNIPSEVEARLTKRDDGYHTITFKISGTMSDPKNNLTEKVGNIAIDVLKEKLGDKVPEKFQEKAQEILDLLQGKKTDPTAQPTSQEASPPPQTPTPLPQETAPVPPQ
ncbi:MAG: AsmA-like C-terminal region-containing protein [Verrucomicrobiota bacterium]